ncbi:hypothetical protein LF1_50470 [Rubripirellula obstinata]|uniref:Uncharacterized protein n=1 Tax=Rubripirellula obstinata TaxID=406547 RepID=A0A5B1CQ15_9BACT|nr:hypothetical protein LF1_50470 [Rubripirellula obstinata]
MSNGTWVALCDFPNPERTLQLRRANEKSQGLDLGSQNCHSLPKKALTLPASKGCNAYKANREERRRLRNDYRSESQIVYIAQ